MFDKLFKRARAKDEPVAVTTGEVQVKIQPETGAELTPALAEAKGRALAADLVRQLKEAGAPGPVRLAIYERVLLATAFEAGAHYAMRSTANYFGKTLTECDASKAPAGEAKSKSH